MFIRSMSNSTSPESRTSALIRSRVEFFVDKNRRRKINTCPEVICRQMKGHVCLQGHTAVNLNSPRKGKILAKYHLRLKNWPNPRTSRLRTMRAKSKSWKGRQLTVRVVRAKARIRIQAVACYLRSLVLIMKRWRRCVTVCNS